MSEEIEMRWLQIGINDGPKYGDVFHPPEMWLRLQYRKVCPLPSFEAVWNDVPVVREDPAPPQEE